MESARDYNVIIVEDNKEFAEGLKHLIDTWSQYKVIDIVYDGTEIINHELLWLTNIVLMDVNMPNLNGIDAGKQVNFHFPDVKMIAITLNKEQVFLEDLVAAGFKGFVDKQLIVEELAQVLQLVTGNKLAFPKDLVLTRVRREILNSERL